MKTIRINVNNKIDLVEFRKYISFVSDKIESIETTDSIFTIICSDDIDEIILSNELEKNKKKFKKNSSDKEIFFNSNIEINKYYDFYEDKSNLIYFGNSQIGFCKKGIFLLNYFDECFRKIALEFNAIEKYYPVLLPLNEYLKTGYIKKSPQYAIFCSSVNNNINDLEELNDSIHNQNVLEKLHQPDYALSPSACFHTYIEYANKVLEQNSVITFKQNVFRNEGRFNYSERGRLLDYQVREIVFIGDNDFVENIRLSMMNKTVELLKKLELKSSIEVAADSFIIPKMQIYKSIQRVDKSKYEIEMNTDLNHTISTASFNLHGKAFTDPFNISVKNCKDTVTGCIGFGLQRWLTAFISQYSWDDNNWPEIIKQEYIKVND